MRTEKKTEPERRKPSESSSETWILIDKSENKLYFYQTGRPVEVFDVATGKEPHFTPEGVFYIANKINLETHGQAETTTDESAGNPEALKPEFGTRWMGLAVPGERDRRGPSGDERAPAGSKYGIHGTNEPESIGDHASGGCIRMRDKDIKRLFEKVETGTKVEIRS